MPLYASTVDFWSVVHARVTGTCNWQTVGICKEEKLESYMPTWFAIAFLRMVNSCCEAHYNPSPCSHTPLAQQRCLSLKDNGTVYTGPWTTIECAQQGIIPFPLVARLLLNICIFNNSYRSQTMPSWKNNPIAYVLQFQINYLTSPESEPMPIPRTMANEPQREALE